MMKKIICCLLGIFIFVTYTTYVHASASWDVDDGFASTGDVVVETPKDKEPNNLGTNTSGTKEYSCLYTTKVTNNTQYTVSVYNKENIEILNNNFTIDKEKMPLSGTSVGINIKETKNIAWEVTEVLLTVNVTEKTNKTLYKCEYTPKKYQDLAPMSNKTQQIAKTCSFYNLDSATKCLEINNCNLTKTPIGYQNQEKYSYTLTLNSNPTGEDEKKFKECKAKAIETAVKSANGNVTASYSLEMTDSNDINGENYVQITRDEANKTMVFKEGQGEFKIPEDGSLKDKRKIEMFYKKYKTCINVKSSKVTYKGKNENCDLTTEMEVSNDNVNGLEHWHYFIPLNAKSNDSIKIKMSPGSNVLSKQQCLYVMKNNQVKSDKISYVDLIKPVNGGEFVGNYKCISNDCDPKTGEFNEYSSDYNEVNNNGCKLTSNAKIYSQQKFYLEDNSKSFKGFNFYYKPINPSNENQVNIIFPNGVIKDENGDLTFNSLWSDWYKKQTTKGTASPDLSKSYNEVTYIAQNINANKIREYNKKHDYTDWTTMSVNGTSNFIDYEGIIERNNNLPPVYKLGCGPANITTQKGCGVK